MKWYWAALFVLLMAPTCPGQEEREHSDAEALPWLYPFVEKGRWGFIGQNGEWVIKPGYDEVGAETRGNLIPIRKGKKWGVINRSDVMVLKPQFGNIEETKEGALLGFSDAETHNNPTLLVPSGDKIKQVACDWLEDFSEGAAWAQRGKYIGLLSTAGEWIIAPKLLWGVDNPLPEPLNHGVSWFERDGMLWGLIGKDGRVLLKPTVSSWAHHSKHGDGIEYYERNSQPWDDGRTWVKVGDRWKLITLAGQELASVEAEVIHPWGDLPCFAATVGNWSNAGDVDHLTMVGFDGKIYLDADIQNAKFHDMPSPQQLLGAEERSDLTKVPWGKLVGRMKETFTAPDGSRYWRKTWFENGCALWQKTVHTPHNEVGTVVGLDFDGRELFKLPDAFYRVEEVGWSEGLAGVVAVIDPKKQGILGTGTGFVDATGKIAIAPQFGFLAGAFHYGFAWVPRQGSDPQTSEWGLIDKEGNQILPFDYQDPGHFFRDYGSSPLLSRAISRLRYEDFVVIVQNGCKGLSTREGKVVLPPEYRDFGDMIEGRAVVWKWDKDVEQMRYGAIDRKGNLVVPAKYRGMSPFSKGVAWAKNFDGVGLVDQEDKVLLPFDYASLLEYNPPPISGWDNPFAKDALCCICKSPDKPGQPPSGWGWVNEKGHTVRWSSEPPPQRYGNKAIQGHW